MQQPQQPIHAPGHAPGETSGSPQRAKQRLTGTLLTFHLPEELSHLRLEPAWQRAGRNANTLVKEPDFRVILTALRRSTRVQEHHVDARLTLQVIEGRLRLHLPDQAVDLDAGQIVALQRGVSHDVEALEDCGFLLTIAWPAGQEPE